METNLKKFNVFEAKGAEVKIKATDIDISKPSDLEGANFVFRECQSIERGVEETRVWLTKPLNDEVKKINNFAKEILIPIDEAKVVIKSKILLYNEEVERKRAEEAEKERKRLEEIRLKEEAERNAREDAERKIREEEEARLEAIREQQEIERKNIEAEQNENKKKEMEIERKRLEEEAKIEAEKNEIARKLREMEEDRKRIDEDRAEMERQKIEEEKRKKQEQLEKTYKVKGVRTATKWEIVDEDKIDRKYCSSDSKKINAAIKKGVTEIAGIKIFEEKTIR